MQRRTFVLSAGALAAGGLALGTGAFDSVEADRDVTVSVANDANGYLGIQPGDGPNGNYTRFLDNGELAIDLTDDNGNVGGDGLNTNAITAIADVFQIQNQGTRDAEVRITPLAFADIDGSMIPPDIDGVLGVMLVPTNPDEIGLDVDVEWNCDPFSTEIDVTGLIGIKDLSPGDTFEFNLAAVALPSSAIGTTSISDELYITAEEV